MRTQDEWLDAETALREIHAEGSLFTEWAENEEQFVAMMLEFAQAAYGGGYEDALDDIEDQRRDRVDALNASLTRLDDSFKS